MSKKNILLKIKNSSMPILIGNNLFIEELPVDYSGKLLDNPPLLNQNNYDLNRKTYL